MKILLKILYIVKMQDLKKTEEKVDLGKLTRVVYKGAHGAKYVKMGGEYMPLSKAKKSVEKRAEERKAREKVRKEAAVL